MAKKKNARANRSAVIFQAKSGAIELRGDFSRETVWATQAQIAEIFRIDRTVATRHVGNILNNAEVNEKSNVQKMHIANSDKPVTLYSLDVILAVGYRTNSARAIEFRQWATKTLRGYIVDGYVINRNRVTKNYSQFLSVVDDMTKLLPSGSTVDSKDAVALVSLFADTWLSLDAYDRDALPKGKLTKKKVQLTAAKIGKGFATLRTKLTERSEATEIFGMERSEGAIEGIVGNVMQSFGGKELYPSVEEKAAHLLYFIVKNHPFIDGNKRSGAFAFVWYLKEANVLDVSRLTTSALTALTILVAESDPKDKEKVIALILNLLASR
jgi:prophage maintenance system killer protein